MSERRAKDKVLVVDDEPMIRYTKRAGIKNIYARPC